MLATLSASAALDPERAHGEAFAAESDSTLGSASASSVDPLRAVLWSSRLLGCRADGTGS